MPRTSKPAPSSISRRAFLAGAAATASFACGVRAGQPNPNGLRVAIVGAGGRGWDDLEAVNQAGARIVALCDCDRRQAERAFAAFPEATRYSDWRRMLERETSIEAVVIGTPDHSHAVVAVAALKHGRHVDREKPLAHSIFEAREMARVARETGLVTQMGTQGHAYEGTRRAVEVMRAGAIGDVKELHVWTDRPAGWWPQGITRPTDTPPIPDGLDWDVWLGPAPQRPYHPAYVPFKWRGFWDFGTGAIGDMGIHNLDTAYWGLELGTPVSAKVRECSPALTDPAAKETAPLWSIIDIAFPARGARPPVAMTWYDGGKLPPTELFQGEPVISKDGGSLIIGSKGTLFTRTWHGGETAEDMFVLLPRRQFEGYQPPSPTLSRPSGHHQEWVDACRGKGRTESPFPYAASLTESLLIGNLALRTGRAIEWDATSMHAKGDAEADAFIRPTFRGGWSL